ncbi:MAG: choice-of-anchor D domain-containing protein, partial [Cytophagia bacterium]
MNTELAGTETGLVSYYKFNQGTAGGTNTGLNTLIDVVGCNNGTLTNFALTGTSSNWVAGKPSLTAVADPVIVRPEINVQGNSVSIIDGNVTPSLTDHTSFGNVGSSISLVRTYTIQNTGASTLTISSIVSSGTSAARFVVSGAPTSVAAGASATFNVTYTPGTAGTHNATITINNTDCDESVYDFAVQGIGVTTSEINLRGNGVDIVRGDLVPTTADHTDFVATGISTAFVRTFTIQNTGGATLNITSINNSNTGDFTVGTFPATIAAGASATFTVTLNSATVGTKTATITINNNDADEGSYDFAITGRVINALPTGVRGNMLSLSGANDVSVPNNAVFEFADGTLEFWIKPTYTSSPGYNPCMISSRNNGGSASDTRYSYHMTGGKTAIELYNGTTVSTWSYTFNTNEWYYVSIVESGTTVEVFVNGISIGTRTTGSSAITGRVFNIGSSGNSERFQGQIDEVRVWNTARTRDQIRENMHLTLSGTESGLVAYYQFNETTGNAVDAVGGNNGTLQNGATRITSEVAIANGTSQRITPSIGLNTFTNA